MAYEDPRVACQPWIDESVLCCEGAQTVDDCDGVAIPLIYPWTDAQLIQAASNMLFARTCYLYPGICTRTVWPCLECGCGCHPCGCGPYEVIHLTADYPILGITEIRIDGVVLDPATYRLEENARVVRVDGEQWPSCNNMGLTAGPTTQGAEVEVEYTVGRVPPIELLMAVQELVCELKKACSGDATCALPAHVRAVSRRGTSFEVENVFTLLESGLTGNPIIDHALSVHRCHKGKGYDATRRAKQVRQS